jgi:hypothetical protein
LKEANKKKQTENNLFEEDGDAGEDGEVRVCFVLLFRR